VLALTFTVRAAGEMRGRLRQLGAGPVRASTFHAAALRQLNYFWPRVVGGRPPRLIDSKAALVREAAKQARIRLDVGDAAGEIEWAKATQIRPDGYPAAAAAAGRSPAAGTQAMGAVYAEYERLRRERHLIDFESVLELTAAILLEDRGAADSVRDTFRYFVVDEYQDVNPLQKLLLGAWLGDRDDLCVVGDPHQVIYSFTGATPAYLTGFTAEFPEATVVRLVRDYRSTPQVVAVANQLVRDGSVLVAHRPAGPRPVLTEYPDDAAETAGLATAIRALIAAGVPAREIAVLVRINADTERFELALAEAGVPYVVRGAERFYERPVVRQALVLLRGAARGEAADAAAGEADGGALPSSVRHVLTGIGFSAASPPAPAGGAAARERWESLTAIAQLADDMHAARPQAGLGEFAAELTRRADLGHAPLVEGVTLASMHAAKGLEWDAVLLPGLVEGLMPIVHARTPEAVEEERRLLYVAVTRAREHLYLSWSPARAGGQGRGAGRPRSRFLDDIRLGRRGGLVANALDKLLDLLDLEQIEVNIFRGRSPDDHRQRVFGGQVAGQALVAAGRTVPADRPVHSLHAYFIRPGDPAVPLVYTVDRVRDGRSFTTRRVSAIQHGRVIFTLSASFHHPEPGPEHADPMPDVPPPEAIERNSERLARIFGEVHPLLSAYPIDLRSVGPLTLEAARDRSLRTTKNVVWLRVDGELPDDPLLHVCLMTYASDLTLLDSVLLAHGLSWLDGRTSGASLDHAMWFHRPFRADRWLLYAQESPVAFGGRGLARGEVFNTEGELVVSVVQEGLVRTSPPDE
jgi:DNA helicase-2/ATP-dependent DNA helicase PcrA